VTPDPNIEAEMIRMNPQDDLQLGVIDHMAGSDVTAVGYLTGPGLFEFPVVYSVVDGRAIHEGCIDMGPADEVAAQAQEVAQRRAVRLTVAFAGSTDGVVPNSPDVHEAGIGLPGDSTFLWTNGRVAYEIDGGVPNPGRVTDAIAHIEANTGIRFTVRTAANAGSLPDYIRVVSNGAATFSSSAIGRRGGMQDLMAADAHPWPVLAHEFLHALGVYHEQSRSDRDAFVEIKWDNIQDGPPPAGEINALGNFQTKPDAVDYFDYDYGSVMHYHGKAFAKDTSKPTIVPRQAGAVIGQRNGLSFGDRQTVAKIYERFFPKGYAGVWRAGSGRYGLWANAEWNDFSGKWQAWSADGLRLVDIHVQPTRQGLRYSGVFSEGTGGHGLWVDAPWESFVAKWQEWSGQGLRLHDIHAVTVNGQDRWTGAFLEGGGGHGLWANATWDSFVATWQEWSGQGLRLHDVLVRSVNGQDRYTGVFLQGSGGHGLWANATWDSFVATWQEWSGQGLRLADLNMHLSGNETRYTAAFLPGNDGHALWANVTWESFAAKWQEFGGQGLRLIDFEIVNPAAGAIFDGVDVGESDLPMAEEPFGGMLAAMEPTAGRVAEQAEGYGAAQFDGQPAPAGAAMATAQGGAVLPNIVAPRDTDEGVRGGLVGSGARDGTATGASGYGGATFG
jgi:hypothetical protein